MNVPMFERMLRPLLVLARDGPITRVSAAEAMASHFVRIPAQRERRFRSKVNADSGAR